MADIKETIDRIEENRAMGLDSLLSKVNGTAGRIINKALVGDEISVEEGEALFGIEDLDAISALAIAADEIRKRLIYGMRLNIET